MIIFMKLKKQIKNIKDKISNYESDINFNNDYIKKCQNQITEITNENFESVVQDITKYKENILKIDKEINLKLEEIKEIDKEIQLSKDSILNYSLFKKLLYNKVILQIEFFGK